MSTEKNDSATMSSETESTALSDARERLKSDDADGAYALARAYWLNNPEDLEALELLSKITAKQGKKELSKLLAKLSKTEDAITDDAGLLFETGYRFIDEREPDLATVLLSRCAELAPNHPDCRYELGFALMQTHRFAEAIPHFEWLLSKEKDFDNSLNLIVCQTMSRNLKRAAELLSQLEKEHGLGQDELKETSARKWILKRLEKLSSQENLSIRDWTYGLYGSVLLYESAPLDLSGKKCASITDETAIAGTLLVLRGLLAEMDWVIDVVEYYNPVSRPLAEALARLMDLPAESYGGPARQERTLLIMSWASDIIGPHKTFVPQSANRSLFAYGLSRNTALPVTPDIIGCLADECTMPWAAQLDVDATEKGVHPMNKAQAEACEKLLARASDLESQPEIIKRVEKLVHFYQSKKEMLLVRNIKNFPERPEYTAEIPV